MQLCKFFSFFVLTCLFSGCLFAKDMQTQTVGEALRARPSKNLEVVVKMVDIVVEKTADKDFDDLFFNITQYSNLKVESESRIPEFPKHWLSKQLSSLKNVILWRGKIEAGETLQLVLSLMEQDSPHWDPDDAIGAAKVILLNQNGRLKIQWGVPKFVKNNQEVEMLKGAGAPQWYIFKGADSRYDVAFSVEQQ